MLQLWDYFAADLRQTPAFPATLCTSTGDAEIGPDARERLCDHDVAALGSHADAPLHYGARLLRSATSTLDPFLGSCRVIHAIGKAR